MLVLSSACAAAPNMALPVVHWALSVGGPWSGMDLHLAQARVPEQLLVVVVVVAAVLVVVAVVSRAVAIAIVDASRSQPTGAATATADRQWFEPCCGPPQS